MRLSRAAAVRTLLATLPVSPLLSLPALSAPNSAPNSGAAADSRSATAGVFQSDDKSFRLALPSAAWQLDETPLPRAEMPTRYFHLRGARPGGAGGAGGAGGGGVALEVVVEPSTGPKRLAELGSLDAVAEQLVATWPQPGTLLSAEKIGRPNMFALDSYQVRFKTGTQQQVVRLALQQSRRYQLFVSLPMEADEAVAREVDALVASFEAYPLNLGCLRASNEGVPPVAICY